MVVNVGDYVVWRADIITTAEEARRYYQERLAGLHRVMCRGREINLFFERGATHVFSVDFSEMPAPEIVVVRRRLSQVVTEERAFSLDRARLMDRIVPAVCNFTFSLPGTSATTQHHRLLHGPQLPDGRYLRVVLRPGSRDMWNCVTAYPIESAKWMVLRGARTAKFPP